MFDVLGRRATPDWRGEGGRGKVNRTRLGSSQILGKKKGKEKENSGKKGVLPGKVT